LVSLAVCTVTHCLGKEPVPDKPYYILASRQDSRKHCGVTDLSLPPEMTHVDPAREWTWRRKGDLCNAAPSGDLRITQGF